MVYGFTFTAKPKGNVSGVITKVDVYAKKSTDANSRFKLEIFSKSQKQWVKNWSTSKAKGRGRRKRVRTGKLSVPQTFAPGDQIRFYVKSDAENLLAKGKVGKKNISGENAIMRISKSKSYAKPGMLKGHNTKFLFAGILFYNTL